METGVVLRGNDLLRVRLIGDLEVRRRGVALSLPASRRTRALLGFLVATAAPHSRSGLCDLLWDGPDDPRASLRWSLSKLRTVVDDPPVQRLVADRERVSFETGQCDIDTVRVQALLADGVEAVPLPALEEAAQLLHGEFLDGLDLPACYRFHHWCMAERERYGALRRSVLQALVARLCPVGAGDARRDAGEGDPERALPHGRAMVAADPLDEAAHATLVRLLAASGRYPDAEQHFEWARELLRREVSMPSGGPLDEAIQQARRALRDAAAQSEPRAPSQPLRPAVPPAPGARRAEAATRIHPLVGRGVERDAIAGQLAGDTRLLLLFAGEPGIGKTRLLDHFAGTAAAAGYRVVRGRCFEAEMVRPYGPWLDALRGVSTAGVPDDTLAQAAPLFAGQVAEGGNRERLFDAAAGLVRSLAALQPLALLLDDLQWIDESSAALLHFLARTLDQRPAVLLGGAARAGEVDDNPWAKGLLQSLLREGRARRLDLDPLDAADARVLLGASPIDAADALRQSGGNPLYLVELSRAAGRDAAGAGRSLDALIDERLSSLDDDARDLLAWAAAMGRELRPETLAAMGLPMPEVLARLERVVRRGLLAPTGEGHVDFAHDLVRHAVYRSLSQPRRRAIHRQIAHALAMASAEDPWLHGEIVRHAGLAGDKRAAARACLAAGEHCLRIFANREAAAVAERGLAYVGELGWGAERARLEINLLGLCVTAAAGPGGRRLPALAGRIERAVEAAEAFALHPEAAAGWQILSFWQQQASDIDRTRAATLAAERATRRADDTTHCLQMANSARCLLEIEADPVHGRALLDDAVARADALGLKVMEIDWGLGLVARADGDLDTAGAALTRAVALARLADNHWREYECMVWLATVDLERGRHADVLRHVDEIVRAAGRMGESQAPFAQALGALARLRQGDDSAAAVLVDSLGALRELDDKAHLAYALNEAAALALEGGRPDAAAALAGEALGAALAVRRATEIAVATARLAAATPDAGQAAALLADLPAAAGGPGARAVAALQAAARSVPTLASTLAP